LLARRFRRKQGGSATAPLGSAVHSDQRSVLGNTPVLCLTPARPIRQGQAAIAPSSKGFSVGGGRGRLAFGAYRLVPVVETMLKRFHRLRLTSNAPLTFVWLPASAGQVSRVRLIPLPGEKVSVLSN